jgi:hypothetical protein
MHGVTYPCSWTREATVRLTLMGGRMFGGTCELSDVTSSVYLVVTIADAPKWHKEYMI